jgi:SAM-dependent methyltransferase
MANERYVIKGGVEGRERLRLLSQVMAPYTQALIAKVGVFPGARCLDVGCGGGDVSFELASVVGSAGEVVGIDLDETKLEIARREAAEQELANLSFEVRDVSAWEPDSPFDFIYARFLLTHLTDPAALLAAVCRHLRPGGMVVVEDIDYRGHFSEPDCPALWRAVELYTNAVRRRGADPHIGPKLPGLLRSAGLQDVEMNLVHPAALQGGMKDLAVVTAQMIADTAIADGAATEAEMRNTVEELFAFASDPETVLGGPRVFQAWGRHPS